MDHMGLLRGARGRPFCNTSNEILTFRDSANQFCNWSNEILTFRVPRGPSEAPRKAPRNGPHSFALWGTLSCKKHSKHKLFSTFEALCRSGGKDHWAHRQLQSLFGWLLGIGRGIGQTHTPDPPIPDALTALLPATRSCPPHPLIFQKCSPPPIQTNSDIKIDTVWQPSNLIKHKGN